MEHEILVQLALIVLFGFLGQWLGWLFHTPVIVILSVFGFLAGPIFGILSPAATFGDILPVVVELAVAVILFEGGLNLRFHEFKEVSSGLTRLFSVGLIFNFVLGTIAAYFIGGLSLKVSFFLGALMVVTGPTVIIPALRQINVSRKIKNYLKWEGIINDPFGALLAVLIFQILIYDGSFSTFEVFLSYLTKAFLISALITYLSKIFILKIFEKHLMPEFLNIPFVLCVVISGFVISNLVQSGAGLITTTFLGLLVGNSKNHVVEELRKFKETITVIMISVLFITLWATLDMQLLKSMSIRHWLFVLAMTYVVRLVSIYASTYKSGMRKRERIIIGSFGPRGIVAASVAGVLSVAMQEKGIADAQFITPIVFSIVFLTVFSHSFTLKPLAKALNALNEAKDGVILLGATDWSISLASKLNELEIPVLLCDISWYRLSAARQLGIETYYGQIVNSVDDGHVDISPYKTLFALTDNDSYNTLACKKFSDILGINRVHQLPVHNISAIEIERHRTKEFCLLEDKNSPLYENLAYRFHSGWRFKISRLTEKYTWDKFLEFNAKEFSMPFLVYEKSTRLYIYREQNSDVPEIGDTIIHLTLANIENENLESATTT